MGSYYKLVDEVARERIEIEKIAPGGIKWDATQEGSPSARLLAWLLVAISPSWRWVCDESPGGELYYECERSGHTRYCEDRTAHYVSFYNQGCADPKEHLELMRET